MLMECRILLMGNTVEMAGGWHLWQNFYLDYLNNCRLQEKWNCIVLIYYKVKHSLCINRVPYFSNLAENTFWSHTTNIATFVVLRHPVTILVADLTNPNNFDIRIKCDNWFRLEDVFRHGTIIFHLWQHKNMLSIQGHFWSSLFSHVNNPPTDCKKNRK